MSDIPQEALDAAASEIARVDHYNPNDYSIAEWNGIRLDYLTQAEVAISAALPFLRNQWEQELLSERTIARVAAVLYPCGDTLAEVALRSALFDGDIT